MSQKKVLFRDSEWLGKLVEKEFLEKLLSSFSRSTGLRAVIIDTKGNIIVSPNKNNKNCSFCQIIRSDDVGIKKCQRCCARAGKEAAKYGEPYIFRCHAGLIAWAVPIILDEHVGSIICGQVLMWEPEDYFLEEIEEMVKNLDVDLPEVKRAAVQLDVMSSGKVQAAADLLFVVANQIMNTGLTVLEQKRQIALQQAKLSEELQARKRAELAVCKMESRTQLAYYFDKEYELKIRIRNNEKEKAQGLLDRLLADIIEHTADFDIIKNRIFELLVIISRAAVDGGAAIDEVLQMNSKLYRQLFEKQKIDEICYWVKEVLEIFNSKVEEKKDQKNIQAIQKAVNYIKKNYQKKLTIDDIAQAVYLSPCYLSRIFKQNMGCTLMEYLAQIRVDKAKVMLKNPRFNIMQVAEQNGFEDPGYFTRVFKKIEGVTPSHFKQKAL